MSHSVYFEVMTKSPAACHLLLRDGAAAWGWPIIRHCHQLYREGTVDWGCPTFWLCHQLYREGTVDWGCPTFWHCLAVSYIEKGLGLAHHPTLLSAKQRRDSSPALEPSGIVCHQLHREGTVDWSWPTLWHCHQLYREGTVDWGCHVVWHCLAVISYSEKGQ